MKFIGLLCGMLLLVARGAFAQDVKTDFDKNQNFSQYRTYYWAKADAGGNDLWVDRLKSSVDAELQSKGWQKVDQGGDIALTGLITAQDKQQLNTFYDGMGPGWGWGGMGSSTTTVSTYRTGTLVLDMYDSKTKELKWRSTAQDDLSGDPNKNQGKLEKSVKKMFEKFPPTPKS